MFKRQAWLLTRKYFDERSSLSLFIQILIRDSSRIICNTILYHILVSDDNVSQSSIAFRTVLLTSMKFWVLLLAAFAISTASPLDSDEGFLCGVCQIMVGTAENLLIGGHTEDEIIADMDKVKLTSDVVH